MNGFTFIERCSWENFNEDYGLQATAECYTVRFGCYPEAILAKQIYMNRENRTWCKLNGIRLPGPAPERRKEDESDKECGELTYRDSCKRNAIDKTETLNNALACIVS